VRKLSLAVAAIAASLLNAAAQEFINDAALALTFEEKLGAIAANGDVLTLGEAQDALKKAEGRKIPPTKKQQEAAGHSTATSLYESVVPAVVALGSVYKCRECEKWHQGGFSSGWIVSSEGLVVTNAHVFEGEAADVPGVMLRDGSVYPVDEIVAADRDADIAILRIQAEKPLPALPLAESSAVGEKVHVVSHPQGRMWSLTSGLVSRFHRQSYDNDGRSTDWMTVTADFAGGSSGGPVLNSRGEVIGMVSSTTTAYSEPTDCKENPDPEVQMVFKDCAPLKALRTVIQP
jgi:serine protease Do